MSDKSQAIAQRRNLLNVIRELEADSARLLRHAEVLRREVERIERENRINKLSDGGLSKLLITGEPDEIEKLYPKS